MTLTLPTLGLPHAVGRTLAHTLARPVTCEGIGLHGGRRVSVRLRPSRRQPGILFRRVDLEREAARQGRRVVVEIPATLAGVSRVDHATTLSAPLPEGFASEGFASEGFAHAAAPAGLASVSTVEHLVAALAGAGIDSCLVEVDGPEIPILDGSSLPWLVLLAQAGRRSLPQTRRQLRVTRTKTVSSGSASITCYPSSTFRVSCSIDFPHPTIGAQELSLDVTPASFARELADARTFGFLHEVEALRAAGLARGGTMDNAIVLDDRGVMNGPLRRPDEFVRHKALDLVGDLALIGMPLAGHFVARRAGHRLHVEFARELLADTSCHVVETLAPELASASLPRGAGDLAIPASRALSD